VVELPNLYVFFDFQNQPVEPEPVIERLKAFGRLVGGKAYGEWRKHPRKGGELSRFGIELIEMPEDGGRDRKRVDINLVVDAMEVLFTLPSIQAFAIVAGDADYVPLIRTLRKHGKITYVIARSGSTSNTMLRVSDQFIPYEEIVKSEEVVEQEKLKDLADEVYVSLIEKGRDITVSSILQTISAMGIMPQNYGEKTLPNLAGAIFEILKIRRREQTSSEYAVFARRYVSEHGPVVYDEFKSLLAKRIPSKQLNPEDIIKEALDKGYLKRVGDYLVVDTLVRWRDRLRERAPWPEYRLDILRDIYQILTHQKMSLKQVRKILEGKYPKKAVASTILSVKFSGLLVGDEGETFVSMTTPVGIRGTFKDLVRATDKFYVKRLLRVDSFRKGDEKLVAQFLYGNESEVKDVLDTLRELLDEGEISLNGDVYVAKD